MVTNAVESCRIVPCRRDFGESFPALCRLHGADLFDGAVPGHVLRVQRVLIRHLDPVLDPRRLGRRLGSRFELVHEQGVALDGGLKNKMGHKHRNLAPDDLWAMGTH